MIAALRGKIVNMRSNYLVLDVNGVGYKVESNAPFRLGLEGQEVNLVIYTHVKENELRLFGFAAQIELDLFEKLITVSGVGPKSAMLIVSTHSPGKIVSAINQGDPKVLQVKGVGQKTLAKIVIELKGKLDEMTLVAGESGDGGDQVELVDMSADSELVQALLNLGFNEKQIEKITPEIDSKAAFSDQVRQALKLLRGCDCYFLTRV